MVRVAKEKVQHKSRTEAEMRQAVHDFVILTGDPNHMPLSGDPEVVLHDCIDELIALRRRTEEMRMFVQEWQVKLSRRA